MNKQLRHMNAQVEEWKNVTVELAEGVGYKGRYEEIENATVLISYNSVVAIWDGDTIFLLPRYDYSATTWKHLHAFIEDYTWLPNENAVSIRRRALEGDNYAFSLAFNLYGTDEKTWHRW